VRFGPKCPRGFLPVFSVNTAEEAERLLVLACQTNIDGEFIASELVEEQTLPNLYAFGDRLAAMYEKHAGYVMATARGLHPTTDSATVFDSRSNDQ
jgi:hypothetical protein